MASLHPRGLERITFDPDVLLGEACIRGLRIPASLLVNLVANGMSSAEIIESYPEIEADDIRQALLYASQLMREKVQTLEFEGAA